MPSDTRRWLAWVDVVSDHGEDRVRRYVTHGVPFLQLTPFRSAAARYRSRAAAETVASFAAGPFPHGAEPAPRPLSGRPRE